MHALVFSRRYALILVAALAAAGCASVQRPACGVGEASSVSDLLYFGTAKPGGGAVTDAEWVDFLAASVTRRFPQGLTVWQATGQWKGNDGVVIREPSFVLNLVHADSPQSEDAIRGIVAEYKARFNQEAVLRVRSPACVSF
jgi:hypothetical protein